MSERIRVLVVDDSAFARKVLREVLATSAGIEVVGHARDGLEALEQIARLSPDVVTLDLVMPNLDGPGVLRALPPDRAPRVVVVSTAPAESDLVVEALALGAVDFVQKPTSLATDRLYALGDELARKVAEAARARRVRPGPAAPARLAATTRPGSTDLVAIGASTGGPQALTAILTALPGDLPCAVAVALHIPAEYTAAVASRLDASCALEVVEASDRTELRPGRVVVARGGMHLLVRRSAGGAPLVAQVSRTPASLYYPSVDVLFASAAEACGARLLGVVLTGMGSDGLEGSRAVRAAGGRVLTQSEASSVIYGMPRVVREAGLSCGELDLVDGAAAIVRAL